MPWKPLAPEARELMERMMPLITLQLRAAMLDDELHARALRKAMHDVLDGIDPMQAALQHGIGAHELRQALGSIGRSNQEPRRVLHIKERADRRKLTHEQENALHGILRSSLPDALGSDRRLWSRDAVRWLVQCETGFHLPDRTLSTYLERWGLAPEKPLRAMSLAHPSRMRAWLKTDYPVIAMLAREGEGRIVWWGHAPMLARQHGKLPPGARAPLVESLLWEPGRFSVLFVTTNRGHALWRVHEGEATAAMVIDHLERAAADSGNRLFVIIPAHALFATPIFRNWAGTNKERFSFHLYNP